MTKSQKGFTIVELVLYMAMLTGFLAILMRIFTSSFDVQLDSQSQSAIEQDGRFILSRLTYDIARADSITTPSTLGGQGSTLVLVIGGVNYTYTLTGNNLTLTANSQTDQLNSFNTQVSSVTFKRIGNSGAGNKDTVQIQYTLTSAITRTGGQHDTKSFQTTIGLR